MFVCAGVAGVAGSAFSSGVDAQALVVFTRRWLFLKEDTRENEFLEVCGDSDTVCDAIQYLVEIYVSCLLVLVSWVSKIGNGSGRGAIVALPQVYFEAVPSVLATGRTRTLGWGVG